MVGIGAAECYQVSFILWPGIPEQVFKFTPLVSGNDRMDKVVALDKKFYAPFIKQFIVYLMNGAKNFKVNLHAANLETKSDSEIASLVA